MTRPNLSTLAIAVLAGALAALGGVLLFGHSRASAAPGYPMMNGSFGGGMMGGGSGYGPGMMGIRSATSSASATLLIRHQVAHCHAWSLSGGPFKAAQTVSLKRGAAVTIINNDVMPHRLVKLAGAPVSMRNGTTMPMMGGSGSETAGLMSHMGARTTVAFATAGVYRFRTRAGEDYMSGFTTTGADNVLTLTVTVR